jgi:hypothetical protein
MMASEAENTTPVHSSIGASSAYRWMMCPASPRLCAGRRSESSEFAILGTAAHALAEKCLTDGVDPVLFVGETIEHEAGKTEVTGEMADGVTVYVETVFADLKAHGGKLAVEQSFDLGWLYPGMYGRNDAAILPTEPCGVLRIYDYKNGAKPVKAENNPQCMYYALGALGADNPTGAETVVITIVQPNSHFKAVAVDSWEVSVDELYRWAREVLLPAAKRTEDPEAPCVAGEWCCFCDAMAVCPLKQDLALGRLEEPERGCYVLPAVQALKPADVGFLSGFFNSPDFDAWRKALAAEELDLLSRGVEIPGRKLVEQRSWGNRKWADEAAVEKALSELGDDLWVRKLQSPAQVEKLLTTRKVPKKLREDRLAPLVTREEKITQVAAFADDPRGPLAAMDEKRLMMLTE